MSVGSQNQSWAPLLLEVESFLRVFASGLEFLSSLEDEVYLYSTELLVWWKIRVGEIFVTAWSAHIDLL